MADFDEKLNQILSNPDAMERIARLAQSLDAPEPSGPPPPLPDAGAPPDNIVTQFLPLLQELGGDSDARRLLYALRPYLHPRKQENVERALRLARLFRMGKKFLSQWEG